MNFDPLQRTIYFGQSYYYHRARAMLNNKLNIKLIAAPAQISSEKTSNTLKYRVCSGQLIPDSKLSFSSALTGDSPWLY